MSESSTPDRADRRQLTVLFCDVAGSTQLLENLDDEDWSYALREYHASCQAVITAYEGHIAQYLGDGLLAYFGYPIAHEDNAHRAVKAGLEILSQIATMNERIQSVIAPREARLCLRIAVHTGVVVVDELGRHASIERIALGIVPTIAARLQQEARDNTLVISEATYRLVRGGFECSSLGSFQLKGISAPQPAYEVMGESGLESRFDIEMSKGLTPFVGREDASAALTAAWRQTQGGAGQVVLIDGDPGIGKSRLVHEFTRLLDDSDCRTLGCRCSPYNRNSAWFPIIQMIHSLLALHRADADAVKLDRIEHALVRTGRDAAESVPLIARLLSIPHQPRYPELNFPPLQEKQRLLDLLIDWVRNEAAFRPVVLCIEDVHWMDPSSQEFLDRLIGAITDRRVLILIAFRPEFQQRWQEQAHVRKLSLGPLNRRAAEAMIHYLQGQQNLTPEVVARLITSTDGVPLFLEESTLMALSTNADPTTIPASLHGLLTARLDQLGSSKEVVQLAATIGLEFSYDVLRSVSALDEPTLRSHVERLVATGIVRLDESASPAAYVFRHALIRDTAYQSLMTRSRRGIHERIAAVFNERFPEVARNQPELVAHHYTKAGLAQRAVDLWQKAGLRSAERYELAESIRHLRKGLEVLATLPASPARQRQELDLESVLAGRLIATEGYGSPGVEKVYTRALELARELGDSQKYLQVVLGLESFHFMRSNFQTAHRLADECLVLARQLGDPARELNVHWVLGEIFFHQGDHALCETHLSECMHNYRRDFRRPRLQDPVVMSWSYCSWTHWMLGYPDRALKTVGQAIELAEQLAHPFSMSIAYSFAAGLHLFRGELDRAAEYSDRAIALCVSHGFPVWQAFCTVVRGSIRARQGATAEGIRDMERGIELWQSSGAVATMPYYLVLLAEGFAAAGRPHDALEKLEEAQSIVDRTGERYYEAEISRTRGELLLQARGARAALTDAESCFLRAIDIAKRQAVRSLELRAVLSLTRLQVRCEPGSDVQARLGSIYHWFTEGMDTSDLVEARKLLADLVW